ncbi:DUF4404 family protein [Thermoproteota archaeon]
MINNNLERIERIINESNRLSNDKKQELLHLVENLNKRLVELSQTNDEEARSISDFAKLTTQETLREKRDEELVAISQKGLQASIRQFEASHPKLIEAINTLFTDLSNLGI